MIQKEYLKLESVNGPLVVLEHVAGVAYGEMVTIKEEATQEIRRGKVIQIEGDKAVIQVFEGTSGIATDNVAVHFTGRPLTIPLSKEILGRSFNGVGTPIDGMYQVTADTYRNINGRPINPVARKYPRHFIETGISAIDALMTLIRGQKLPIFSGNGMAHNALAVQIISQAGLKGEAQDNFAIVFGAMGVRRDDAHYFLSAFEAAGVLDKVVTYINYADAPIVERTSAPRCALTAAEYLAFTCHMHVLVVLTDMTSYAEALREIASIREEIPSRKGYPGYLYSDLATLYERAGMLKNQEGSITLLPILTMPNDDMTHPIPDLTGFITEGQIVLSRELEQKAIYPPIAVLPSLSRLMKDGIGEGETREDHVDLANQLFSAYAKVQDIRALAQIIGEDDLSVSDQCYLQFGRAFENVFVAQGKHESRSIETTLDLGWQVLGYLPISELDRVQPELLEKYYQSHQKEKEALVW